MNSEQIKDMHLLYNAVYNEELREQFDEYNNTIYDENIVEFATEYFYSHGLNDDGIDILIEELGVGEFVEFVYDIAEEFTLTEARRSGRIEPVTKSGKPIGSLKGGAKTSAIAAKRRQKQSERNGSDDRPSGMTAALRSQATKTAEKNQPETKSTPDKTKKGIAARIGGALKRAGEDIAITYKVAREVGKRAENSAPVKKFWGMKEEVEAWVNQLVEEGYDLSEYTWDEMVEIYESSGMSADDRRTWNRLVRTHGPEPFTNPRKKSKSDTRSASMVSSAEEPKPNPKRKTQLGNVQIREDIYDVILSHLIEEGYAESVEQAEVIMVNMSEEWRESICEASPSNPNLYKGKHGQTPTQYMAGRSDAGKIISGDDKSGPLGYSNRYINDKPTQPGQRTTTQRTSQSMKAADLKLARLRYNQSVKDGDKFGGPKGLPKGGGSTAQSASGGRSGGYTVGGSQGYGISNIKLADSYDIYDVILSHLIEEGYAESVEQAEVIMVNMSEEWRGDILESFVLPTAEKSRRINTFLNNSLGHLKLYSKQIDTAQQELADKTPPTHSIGKLVKKTNSLSKRMKSARSAVSPRSNIRNFRRNT